MGLAVRRTINREVSFWLSASMRVRVFMKHESIIVVYDSCQAMAEKIADKLGAETVSVQSMNIRQVENCQSFVLAVEFMANGQMAPHWQYAFLTFREVSLKGKNFAVFVALGNKHDNGRVAKEFCDGLKEKGAHIVGELLFANTHEQSLDNWICAISPNL
jgi:flavodoxin